ncbi:sigma factor G inhibitor Gin [Peribacillus kribbensis]|uniref:sigma factor G inhibitor Gin n=1 Tax=Peribacillus kribbensis TaxID=356658 RepID=UPI00047AFD16
MDSAATKKVMEEICVVCEQPRGKGIHLYTSFICRDCEKDITSTDTKDPKYIYIINQLKKASIPEIYS